LGAADITLDGIHRATSDVRVHDTFPNVKQGTHVVQIALKSSRPFWYTTPSKVSTETDSTVDFRVIYPAAQIVGDALNGVSSASDEVAGSTNDMISAVGSC
jgi:hypothetical protein